MDMKQDSKATSTSARQSGFVAQEYYCARDLGAGAKKRRGNGEE